MGSANSVVIQSTYIYAVFVFLIHCCISVDIKLTVHTTFELDCVDTFPDNLQKPSLSVIFWPKEGQNLANMGKKLINSEQSPNKCTHLV